MKHMTIKDISFIIILSSLCITGYAQTNKSLDNYCICQNQDSTSYFNKDNLASARVLDIGMNMALISKTIIIGSCWEFVNEVYKRAGVALTKKTIFKSRLKGPYANPKLLEPGDWIYHINKSYNNIEHSAIFICWKDFKNKIAITLSYAGMNRSVPASYGAYDISKIFAIFRPFDPSEAINKSFNNE